MFSALSRLSLVSRILIAIFLGVAVALVRPDIAPYFSLLGSLFIQALKSVAPILVFVLVLASIANFQVGKGANIRPIMIMYVVGMLLSAFAAVIASIAFPSTLFLNIPASTELQPPSSLIEILKNLLLSFVTNPVVAMSEANFIGILAWAIILGIAFRHAKDSTKDFLNDAAAAINHVIKFVIAFAALVINPILVFIVLRKNPYPLVFKCLKESGITAFFTRSSAANIPVNLDLARRLGVREATAGIAIPLGATVNMAGAAVTITVLTLATVSTLGIPVDLVTMLILSVVATVSACGASGVAGGSLLLIPVACGLFGISSVIAMQVVAIGLVIGVLQDSAETALNSSTDVLFTAAVDLGQQ